jgi:hypothetical protein
VLQNSSAGKSKGEGLVCFVPSFTPAEWDIVSAAWDGPPEKLTYSEHRALQSKAAAGVRKQGIEIREIRMDPRKMLSWQRKNNYKNDQEGRSAYYVEAGRCSDLGMPEPS